MRCLGTLLLILGLLVSLAAAQEPPAPEASGSLSLERALSLAPDLEVAVLNARVELDSARRADARAQADPFALRVPTMQARQLVEQAEETLAAAVLGAKITALSEFHATLEARDSEALDQQRLELARLNLDAAEIRLAAGAVSPLDVERARNDVAGAERSLRAAADAAVLAAQRLGVTVGLDVVDLELVEPSAPEPLPALDEVLGRIGENASVRAAERAVELARARLAAVDNPYSARADVEAAKDASAAAERAASDVRERLELSLRQAYGAAEAAEGRRRTAEDGLVTAQNDAEAQRIRLEAGSISRLALLQALLQADQAAAQARVARHGVAAARFQLEQVIVGGGR